MSEHAELSKLALTAVAVRNALAMLEAEIQEDAQLSRGFYRVLLRDGMKISIKCCRPNDPQAAIEHFQIRKQVNKDYPVGSMNRKKSSVQFLYRGFLMREEKP